MKNAKRALSLMMCLILMLSVCSVCVFAAEDGSALEPVAHGSFSDMGEDNAKAAPRYASVLNEDVTEDIDDSISWHNGAIFTEPGEYTVSANVNMNSAADGTDTNDFSGLGAALMASGEGVFLTVDGAEIETTGVAKLALFTDKGAVSVVKNSSLTSNGGTIYDGYISTADQLMMVAPPWVLGMGGPATNARTTNIMGDYSTAAYVDSSFTAGGWAALSTDSGSNMHMVVVNTDVTVPGSGYGAYTIGESTEDYYGVTENVSTYANIMTGGKATYQSYTGGDAIDVVQYDGETDEYGFGEGGKVVATVSSDKVTEGEKVNSSITSEEFGFMCHANGPAGTNIVNVLDGTSVKTGDAIFLVKKVSSVFNVDSATLESGTGVLLQIIDNDDDYVGLDFSANWGFEDGYGHSVGQHIPTFNSVFHEEEGYSNEWAVNETPVSDNYTSQLNLSNTTVTGDIWNSTGYVGSNPATTLTVNLGEGASLTGLIASGAFSHTTKEAKVGDGDWSQASVLGHVTNIVNSNGKNLVNVVLTDNAVWTVSGDSLIASLQISGDAQVVVPEGVTLTVGNMTYTNQTLSESDSTISVLFGDAEVQWSDVVPFIDANGRTMVPLRAAGEAMGLTVTWDNDAREAVFSDGEKTIYFPIDSNIARTDDGQTITMDTAAVIRNDRTYAPMRWLAEYFGYEVTWSEDARLVTIQ